MPLEHQIESQLSEPPALKKLRLLSRITRNCHARLAALLIAFGPITAAPASEPGHAPIPVVGSTPAKPEHQPIVDNHAEQHTHRPEAVSNFTREQLQEVLTSRIYNKTLKEILDLYRCQCVDGRGTKAIAGVPGGDQGIIMAGLAAYEKLSNARLTDADVDALLAQYPILSSHTDDHSTHFLHEKLERHPKLKHVLAMKGSLERLIEEGTGDTELDEELLNVMADLDAVGCGHFKNMMKNGGAYGTRGSLAVAVWKSTLRKKWHDKKSTVMHTVLTGNHEERAVTMTQSSGGMAPHTRVPTLLPSAEKGGQMFVSHGEVAEYCLKHELVDRILFIAKARKLPMVDRAPLLAAAQEMLGMQTLETVSRLAKGRPIFIIHYREDGTFTIESKGTVVPK